MPIAAINGAHIHYEVHGKGTPIVFIHPPLLTSANFRYQQVQLAGEFTVVTFDIRGHGRSGASDAPLTYALIAEDMKRLLDDLGIPKAFVCGYSTGGSIALEAMLNYPDRFVGGILVSAMSEVSDLVLKSRIRLASYLSKTKPMTRLLMWAIAWGNADSGLTFRNLLKDAVRGNMANIHQYYKYSLNYNCTGRLRELKAPVLLLCGGKDRGFKRYRRKLEKMLPNCETVELDEKHQIPTKAALAMNESIRRWIRSVRPGIDKPRTAADAPRPDPSMAQMLLPGADSEAQRQPEIHT
ncbi:alpha/beta fold hydrolase [Paenibacillus sp. GYB003]|uniref:alpha/beta fold hydrolase n=1 Tax=Paenibacillus sp. GYB003 TaxID=2994392 RepID=UPI002F96DE60